MIRHSIAVLALLSALLAIVGLSLVGVGRPEVEQPTAKLADRVLYYVATHEGGPRFRVSGQDDELRFITHLVIPAAIEYDPRRVFSYGLRFVVLSPEGNELWRKEVFSESRQSKAGVDPNGWRLENTFSADPRQQFTDDRMLRLAIPSDIPSLSVLEVTTVDEQDKILLRAYRTNPLGPAQRLVANLSASVRQRTQLFQRITFLPWLALSDGQRSYAVTSRWERISADGEPGRDYHTETVYFTGFRIPYESERSTVEGLLLSARRDAALAVHGPTDVDLLAVGGCAERFVGASVNALLLDGAGQMTEYHASTCPGELSLSIPTGPHSLRLSLEGTQEALYVHSYSSAPSAAMPRAPLDPDLRSISMYRTGPGQPVFTTRLTTLDDLDSKTLSLGARRITPEHGEGFSTQWRATISYEFLGERGDVLARGQWPIEGRMSPKILDLVLAPRIEGVWLPSEAAEVRVLVPPAAHEVRVWSDEHLAVAVSAFMRGPVDEPVSLLPPYDDFLTGVRWRFAPLARRTWYPLRPTNHADFEISGGAVRLVAPVRLEPLDLATVDPIDEPEDEPLSGLRHWVSVIPSRFVERQVVLDRREAPASPPDNRRVYSPIHPGRETRIVVDDLDRTQLVYVSERSDDLGRELTVSAGSESLSHRLISSRGRLTLPIATTGEATLRIEVEAPSTRFFVDRPTTDRRARLVQRTLYRIDPSGLTVSVANRESEAVYLNAVIYGCSPRPRTVRIDVSLDGGSPRRIYGRPFEHLTEATKDFELPPVGRTADLVFLTRASGTCSELGHLVLTVGDDVAAGNHEFEIRPAQGEDVWARFFYDAVPATRVEARTWTEQGLTTEQWDLDDD